MEPALTSRFKTLGRHPIEFLASFHKDQGATDDCAAYSVAAAISILRGGQRVDYLSVNRLANRRTTLHWGLILGVWGLLFGRELRLWPGGPITPKQQANLARVIGQQRGLKIKSRPMNATPNDLVALLSEPNKAVLVTIGWDDSTRPRIIYPDGTLRRFAPVGSMRILGRDVRYPFGAHVMVLAAYDPGRGYRSESGRIPTRWGFVNSWVDGGTELFWMPDEDFLAAWGYDIWLGRNKIVVIQYEHT